MIPYVVADGRISYERVLAPDITMAFEALQIRDERTGIHARITLSMNGTALAWSIINVEKDEERVRLSNSAYGHLNGHLDDLLDPYPKAFLKHDLDEFCKDLWDTLVGEDLPEPLSGTEAAPARFVLEPYILEEAGTILFAPAGRGKALDDDTPILTTLGWKRHGDIVAGDSVFGRDGRPKVVQAVSRNEPRPAMTVTFSDGEIITADECHEWVVDCYREGNRQWFGRQVVPQRGRPFRTEEILETRMLMEGQRRPASIRVTEPLQMPDAELPIDPYVLGAWLGDGIRGTGSIAVGGQDIDHFSKYGRACKAKDRDNYWRVTPPLLIGKLREMSVRIGEAPARRYSEAGSRHRGGRSPLGLHPKKHSPRPLCGLHAEKRIPEVYQLSSYKQRLALLQGLMDTDGYVEPGGRCEIVSVYRELAEDYLRLIASLGMKVRFSESLAKLNGHVISPRWRLHFYPDTKAVCRLPRKALNLTPTTSERVHRRFIKSVDPAGIRSMQCIQVEGGVYLAGRALIPTHNSFTAYLMAVSVDAGMSTLWPATQAPVLLVNLERSAASVASRLGSVNVALGLDRARPLLTLNGRGRSLSDVLPAVGRAVKQHGVRLVVLDSISRAGMGDLNANQDVNRIADALNGLHVSWLGLGHTPRADESHIYGGIHFEAAADVVIKLVSEQDAEKAAAPLGVGLLVTKANDLPPIPLEIWAYEFNLLTLRSVRPAKAGEFTEIESMRKKPNAKRMVREYILDQDRGRATTTEIAAALGLSKSTVSAALSDDAAFVKLPKQGRDQPYGVRLR